MAGQLSIRSIHGSRSSDVRGGQNLHEQTERGGAEAVLVPAEWVPGALKEDHWMTLVRARALENTIYVAAADQNAPTGSGHSVIVDPMGVVLASLGERTGTAGAELNRERLAEVRAKNPALELRRFTVAVRS